MKLAWFGRAASSSHFVAETGNVERLEKPRAGRYNPPITRGGDGARRILAMKALWGIQGRGRLHGEMVKFRTKGVVVPEKTARSRQPTADVLVRRGWDRTTSAADRRLLRTAGFRARADSFVENQETGSNASISHAGRNREGERPRARFSTFGVPRPARF